MPEPRVWVQAAGRLGQWHLLPALIVLYLLGVAALVLPWPFGAHPPWAYNWEGYTAWRWAANWEGLARLSPRVLAPTDGLMTDSGQGPLVGLPVTLGVALGGFDLAAMRLPVALLAAASIPVFWLLGRRVVGAGAAMLAAMLLSASPVFLFYGRTATLVGISLLPLLLSALALARVLDPTVRDGWRWRREGALAASLLFGIYAYAPVRLLWPLTLAMLALAGLRSRARRRVLWGTALLCALAVPAALMALEQATVPQPDPVAAAAGYFHARGEQLVAMSGNPAEAGQYVRGLDAGVDGWETAARLVGQNAADLGRLLLDRGAAPVPTDYWNERGRLWPWYLAPFAVAGALAAVAKGLRGGPTTMLRLLPLLLALGLALPLLLTSRVHVGRLLPALPFALLLVASGIWACAGRLASLARCSELEHWFPSRRLGPALAALILAPAIAGARTEMLTPLSPTRESRTAALLAEWQPAARQHEGAVLVEDPALGDEIERVHAATYRLDLDAWYRFEDLQAAEGGVFDERPALTWHGALDALRDGTIDRPCARLWFVAPEVAGEFAAAWRAAGCTGAPESVTLP